MNEWSNRSAIGFVSLFCFVAVFFVTAFAFFSSADADNKEKSFTNRQRPPVNFLEEMHDMHMETYECLDCHHSYEKGENVLDESELEEGNQDIQCAACHHSESKTGLREAFHNQCIGCHEKRNDQEGGSLPILCGECHVRHGNAVHVDAQ
jgi:Class III cytochrome C family